MKENIFTVDLGEMKLSDDQRKEINAAVQKAVTGVLARTGASNNMVLFPINHWPKGPIWNGIISRPWDDFGVKNLDQLFKGTTH